MATIANLNPDDDKNQQPQTGQQQAPQVAAPSVTTIPGSPVSAPNAATAKNQGSGRFTNINKYIGANQQAGQQIANRVGQGINTQLEQTAKGAEDNASAFRQGVQNAQTSNTTGQGILNNVQGGNTQALTQMTAQPDALKQYVNYRTGQEAMTQQKAVQDAQAAAVAANEKAQADLAQRQQQLSTEQNRTGLLTEFVGTPGGGYNKGAQRLDQAFLQRDKSNALGNLAQSLKDQEATRYKALAQTNKAIQDQAKATLGQSADLAKNISKAQDEQLAAQNKLLQDKQAQVNQQRLSDADMASRNIQALLDSDPNTKVDANWLAQMGLSEGQRTYGVLGGLSQGEIATINPTLASIANVGSADELAKLNALNRLAGTSFVDNQAQYAGPQDLTPQELAAAVQYAQGDKSLAGRINSAQGKFDQAVADAAAIRGIGNWGNAWYGENQTIKDYLNNPSGGIGGAQWESASFGSNLPWSGGRDPSLDDRWAAEGLAAQDRIRQINAWLDSQNYRETLGGGGRTILDSYSPDANLLERTRTVK